MKASELIENLQKLIEEHGDQYVFVEDSTSSNCDGFTIGSPEYRENIEYYDWDGNDWHCEGFFIPECGYDMF